jgi:pimeloyl-ACP methyl ester carboxylesterase
MTAPVALISGGIVEMPTWFGPADRPLFGWFSYHEGAPVREVAVICQPLAEDGNKAYRTMREVAAALARDGVLVLRFDYDGTGDSAGGFNDPGRREAWIDSVHAAVEEARRWGSGPLSLLGMRMGGAIAVAAARSRDLDLERLILWDPSMSGRSYLREQQLLHSVWPGLSEDVPPGSVETPGYLFAPETVAETRTFAVDPGSLDALARSVTVLLRDDRPVPPHAQEASQGRVVTWELVGGQAELLDVPTLDAVVPWDAVRRVTGLFAATGTAGTADVRVHQRASASWEQDGIPLEETACFLGADARIFGMVTAPAGTPEESDPEVVFVNVAYERHIGVGRQWTDLARTLAGDGVGSIRVDHSGVGDSGVAPGQRVDTFYDPAWIEDLPEVAREIGGDGTRPVIGVGLCSSAMSVLEAASRGALTDAVAINSIHRITAEDEISDRWTIFSRLPSWLTRLAVRHARIAGGIWSAWNTLAPRTALLGKARRIAARGTGVTLLNGRDEHERAVQQNRIWWSIWGRGINRSPRFRVVGLDDADHSLRGVTGRDAASDEILRSIRVRLGTSPGSAVVERKSIA